MGDFFDNTVLFASKHIERVFGVEPKDPTWSKEMAIH